METLWLSPFFASPQADFGYDIQDHTRVDPVMGDDDVLRRLIEAVHARGMKIVFDLVLNHTSDRHPWFLESRSSRSNAKRDWYLWRDGRGEGGASPPNNWHSMLGGSGWNRDEATGQWYWSSFLPFQPDLNYRNPEVKQAMLDVVRHWLGRGVDGFRLDIFNAIYKDASFADNPFALRLLPSEDDPSGFFQRPLHTIDHPDTLAFARELRAVVDEHRDPPRFLVGEVFGSPESLRRYCGENADGLNLVFLFKTLRTRFRCRDFRALIEEYEAQFPEPFVPTYVFGNHDRPRLGHRLDGDPEKAKLLATLQLTARGVPFVYYGEEIGMRHHPMPLAEALDPIAERYRFVPDWLAGRLAHAGILLARDECRRPMQWDASRHAGFTRPDVEPWLAVDPRSRETNVEAQRASAGSILNTYRALFRLRRSEPSLRLGRLELFEAARLPDDVLGYRRATTDPRAAVDVFLNFASRRRTIAIEEVAGRTAFRSRTGETRPVSARETLAPFEALVVHRA